MSPTAPGASALDMSGLIDRLAAAREMLAPAAAALSIDHAEFGELSLRFDQHRDGRLSAQIVAADPHVQREIAAAVATETGHPAGNGQSSQNQQQHPAHSFSHPRGGATEREGGTGTGGQPPHRDPPQRATLRSTANVHAPGPRGGIFA